MSDIIYRVQDKSGRGPFRPGLCQYWVESRLDLANLPPWYLEFSDDVLPILKKAKHVGCGCLTLDQLKRWIIKEEYVRLRLFGYSAVEIPNVEIVAKSDIQALFTRKTPLNEGVKYFELY